VTLSAMTEPVIAAADLRAADVVELIEA